MFGWLKANRLKAVSVLAVGGDILMGAAGIATSGFLLTMAGALGLVGHGILFVWGRGAKAQNAIPAASGKQTDLFILMKPFLPWRYPLDSAFCIFVVGSIFYIAGGIQLNNMPLVGVGLQVLFAAGIGWLWPQEKPLFGFRSVQVTAILYAISSVFTLWAGIVGANIYLILAAFSYGFCNLILFTVRKENQSTFTQTHEF